MPRPLVALDATLVSGTNTGDSSYWTGLVKGFSALELDFDIVLLSDCDAPIEVSRGMSWKRLPGKRGRWFSAVTMPLAARRLGAKVFHTQYTLSPLAVGGITTIHDVSFFVGPKWFRAKDRFLMQRTVPASARRARRVITVSETSKRDIVKYLGVSPDKVTVTYNAVGENFARTDPRTTLDKLGIHTPYLLTIGARWPRKNMKLAIDAVSQLPNELPHKLVIVGKEGWGDEGVSDRVQFTGFLPNNELPALYSGASLYLFPSYYEGFGIPMVEAFACGTPVLSSAGGALPEVSGGAAEILDSWDAKSWASRIESLLNDSSKLDQMRERGYARAKQFSWQETARKTADVYREILQ